MSLLPVPCPPIAQRLRQFDLSQPGCNHPGHREEAYGRCELDRLPRWRRRAPSSMCRAPAGPSRPGPASRDRHARSPALLRRAGRAATTCSCRTIRATAARSGRTGCAACATSPWSIAACSPSSRSAQRGPGRARLRRLDRGRDGQHGAGRSLAAGAGRRDGHQAAAGRHPRPRRHRLHRLRPRRLPRPEGVRPGLRRRALDRPARDVGHLPRDELPHRLEALHVQPDPAAPAGRGARAGAGRVGRRRQGRAAERRRASMPRRCPTPGSRSSRAAAIASTWSSPRRSPNSSPTSSVVRSRRHAPDVFHRAADVGLLRAGRPRLRRHRADVLQQATSIRSPAGGSTTTTSSNTCWPRRSASTASC